MRLLGIPTSHVALESSFEQTRCLRDEGKKNSDLRRTHGMQCLLSTFLGSAGECPAEVEPGTENTEGSVKNTSRL